MESTSVACEQQRGSSSEASRENDDDDDELEMVRVNSGRRSGSEFGSGIFSRIFSPITALHLSDRTECETASFLKALGREKREQKKNVLLKFSRKKKTLSLSLREVVNNVSRERERRAFCCGWANKGSRWLALYTCSLYQQVPRQPGDNIFNQIFVFFLVRTATDIFLCWRASPRVVLGTFGTLGIFGCREL